MKGIFTILLTFLSFIAFTQNLEILGEHDLSGEIGRQIESRIIIKNTSNSPVEISISRTTQSIGTTQRSWFCWNSDCFEEETNKLPFNYTLKPGEVVSSFRPILNSGISEGFSSVTYTISEKSTGYEHDFKLSYSIRSKAKPNAIFNSAQLDINDVYPNPVREFAIIDYSLKDSNVEAKVTLHSILGSIVLENTLNPMESKLKLNTEALNPGVYFYTIYLDGEGILTRKIIIQK